MNVCNAKIKKTEEKIPDITNLATNTSRNTKINKAKNEIPIIIIILLLLLLKIKYLITTPEFNKLTAETFARD